MSKKFCPNHPNKRLWSKGLCIDCFRKEYARPLKKTPLKPISEKQKNILAVYRLQRRTYLRLHPTCQINLKGCTIAATEIHHSAKKYTKKLWLDTTKYLACCRHCHRAVEDSPALAKELGIYNFKIKDEENKDNISPIDAEFINAIIWTNNDHLQTDEEDDIVY